METTKAKDDEDAMPNHGTAGLVKDHGVPIAGDEVVVSNTINCFKVLLQDTHSTNPHLPSLFLNPIQVEDAKVRDTDAVPYCEVSHLITGLLYLIALDLSKLF